MSALLEIDALQLGPIGTNCYVVRAAGSRTAIVVDPGGDAHRVLDVLDHAGLEASDILVTHGHYDHIGGVADLAAATGAPVWMNATEAATLETPEEFAFPGLPPVAAWRVDHRLNGTERFEVADLTIDTLLVPGHSPGHLAFVIDGVRDASG
ncbi:MAG: fold metallo-hydrolase, partial [Thermoleophilia bacterium]|nr:fold metallo-hydrolase [Thermoleophilia bacterium]